MLRGGELDGVRVLSPAMVALMTREVTAPGRRARPASAGTRTRSRPTTTRWAGARRARTRSPRPRAFGHGGVSGTRLWIDPAYDLVYVYLTGSWGLPTAPIDAVQAAIYAAVS